jgi:hypothetical protein
MMFKRRKNAYVLKLRLDSLLCARIGSRRWYTVVALASRPKCHSLKPTVRRFHRRDDTRPFGAGHESSTASCGGWSFAMHTAMTAPSTTQ